MKTLDDLKADREVAAAELARIDKRIEGEQRKTLVQCTSNVRGNGCGMGMQIGELEYIQTYHYVPPRGCTEGDYWLPDEGQFICPHCGHLNRLFDRPAIEKLKHLFKSRADKRDRR